jgi:hypothetical protein
MQITTCALCFCGAHGSTTTRESKKRRGGVGRILTKLRVRDDVVAKSANPSNAQLMPLRFDMTAGVSTSLRLWLIIFVPGNRVCQ